MEITYEATLVVVAVVVAIAEIVVVVATAVTGVVVGWRWWGWARSLWGKRTDLIQ